ncbi:hypothetical protein IQ07DRAFT_570087 [Pyrenochaeta sp. DS3sAY3a]|nr:hypothetical protein IQ07DRAFT_570087 [Pyrenochaeta sp. DS3sAY3a]
MATQRLRKTFKYPSASDDEDAVEEGMDEQDQATLISKLSSHDTSTTYTYTLLLLVLPLAPALLHIPLLFSASTVLPAAVAIASFLATAYTLYALPLPPQEPESEAAKKAKAKAPQRGYAGKTPPWEKEAQKSGRRAVPFVSEKVADVLAEYIVAANRAVAGVLALLELRSGKHWVEGLGIGGGYLPLVVCIVILYARTELRIIDMDELKRLKKEGAAAAAAPKAPKKA